MSRPLRIQYPGAVHHVMCLGIERRAIYGDDEDRRSFLDALQECLDIYKVVLHAYVLMGNHFHLLVECSMGNLSEFMRRFNIQYTYRFNRRHRRAGNLYQGRYKAVLVEKEPYLHLLSRYIHLNPVRIKGGESQGPKARFDQCCLYRWSSLPGYLSPRRRESFLTCDTGLNQYGGDSAAGRRRYARRLLEDLDEGGTAFGELDRDSLTGWILGGEKFIEDIKGRLKGWRDRERPQVRRLRQYKAEEKVLAELAAMMKLSTEELLQNRGTERQMAMEALYRFAGLTGKAIGDKMGLDYSTVSVERKRFRLRLEKEPQLISLFEKLEKRLARLPIDLPADDQNIQ
jgi:putative transposase